MKKSLPLLLLILLLASCFNKKDKVTVTIEKDISELPFTTMELNNASSFIHISKNWNIVGSVYADRSKEKSLITTEGKGILANLPNEKDPSNLFTIFKHGDMELEVDVMMAKGSNSGLYFQGRYEVQLLDSWGIKEPQHSDIGGIYHRWDDARGTGNEGFEGSAPKINAAKAPGLWQHFRIIFHAPRFDDSGEKIKNAEFEEVWLNGMLVQKNVEVTGPTRASAFNDEQPEGPLMIQGDHGPVALKNIKYKLYGDKKVALADVTMKEFENTAEIFSSLDSLKMIREIQTDTLSASMTSGENPQRILSYTGNLVIPESGDYLFDYRIDVGGGALIVENDTIINHNGRYVLDSLGFGKKYLKKGNVAFQLIYNKYIYWKKGFALYVEGPGIQKHALHAPSSVQIWHLKPEEHIMIEVVNEAVLQRNFWMFKGKKRTHCISVGTPQGLHYTYDLANGALLQVWNGDFLDVTEMWRERGEKQLAEAAGFSISFHGNPEFTTLANKDAPWPMDADHNKQMEAQGYTLSDNGLPTFNYKNGTTTIDDKLIPSNTIRSFNRMISFSGKNAMYHKIAEGQSILKLPDGTYMVNDESYFINFPADAVLKPFIRQNNGKDELIFNIPAGDHTINYSITW